MIKNLNSLLELAAGHSYKVLDVTDTMVSVLHRKCGNEFTSTVTDIARAGFSCPRCNETRADKMLTTLQNEHSKELYEAVKAKLPAGYNIFYELILRRRFYGKRSKKEIHTSYLATYS